MVSPASCVRVPYHLTYIPISCLCSTSILASLSYYLFNRGLSQGKLTLSSQYDVQLMDSKIPVYPNAPLLNPTTIDSSDSERISPIHQWPLVMFSHGLGGSRTAYRSFHFLTESCALSWLIRLSISQPVMFTISIIWKSCSFYGASGWIRLCMYPSLMGDQQENKYSANSLLQRG